MAEEEVSMTPDIKVMYKAFVTQFQKLNSRLDDMDERRRGVSYAISRVANGVIRGISITMISIVSQLRRNLIELS